MFLKGMLGQSFQRLKEHQSGAVSIYVSFLMMIILSLMCFTFGILITNHFLQVRDNQYGMQAYYAAESGINDARNRLQEQIVSTQQGVRGEVRVEDQGSLEGSLGDQLGLSLDISGRTRLGVGGANKVYVLDKVSRSKYWQLGTTTPITQSGGNFGQGLGLKSSTVMVGSPGLNQVSIYTRSGSSWSTSQNISAPASASSSAKFGQAIAFEGNTLIIGAPGDGAVYHYVRGTNQRWTLKTTIVDAADFGAAVSYRDSLLAVGKPGVKAVYIYNFNSSANRWDRLKTIGTKTNGISGRTANHVTTFNSFGSSLVLREGLLLVGTPSSDKVDIFRKQSQDDWYWHKNISYHNPPANQNIYADGLTSGQRFGASVALTGNLIAVGAPAFGTTKGKVYFLTLNDTSLVDLEGFTNQEGCPDEGAIDPPLQGFLDEDGNIEYSCVIVDLSPPKLVYDSIDTHRSVVLPLLPVDEKDDPVVLESLSIEWDQANPWAIQSNVLDRVTASTSKVDEHLTDVNNWDSDVPLLRVQITIVDLNQTFNRQTLNDNTEVFFLYPSIGYVGKVNAPDKGAEHRNYGGKKSKLSTPGNQKQAVVLNNNCSSAKENSQTGYEGYICKATLRDLPKPTEIKRIGSSGSARLAYVVRIQAYYEEASLRVSGQTSGNKEIGFKDIQASITATGRVHQVFARVQKRIPLRPVYDIAEYGIDSAEDVCKILAYSESVDIDGSYLHTADLNPPYEVFPDDLPESCWLSADVPDWQDR